MTQPDDLNDSLGTGWVGPLVVLSLLLFALISHFYLNRLEPLGPPLTPLPSWIFAAAAIIAGSILSIRSGRRAMQNPPPLGTMVATVLVVLLFFAPVAFFIGFVIHESEGAAFLFLYSVLFLALVAPCILGLFAWRNLHKNTPKRLNPHWRRLAICATSTILSIWTVLQLL